MSCRLYHELASDQLDAALDPAPSELLAAHLARCRACATARRELEAQRDLLASLGSEPPPLALDRSLYAALEAEASRPGGRARRLLGRLLPRPSLLPSAALSASLLLAFLALLAGAERPRARNDGAVDPPPLRGQESLLTVWDSAGERIVAAIDPDGLAVPPKPADGDGVRIFLYRRIVVRG